MAKVRPNLLLLMTDQQRHDALGCAAPEGAAPAGAGGWVRTPNLDRLAAEGVRFTNCVTTSPVCIPARLSLATGLYPHNTWVWDNQGHTLDPRQPTWMQAVRDAGYRTSLFGKTHLHPHAGDLRAREHLLHAYGLDDVDEIGGPRASARVLSHMTARWQGLGLWQAYQADLADRFATDPHRVRPSPLPLEEYADVYVGRRAREYLQAYDRTEPWFCWVSFGGPHEPWDTPEPFASLHDPDDMPAPVPLPDWTRDPERPRGRLHRRLADPPCLQPGDAAALRASYAGNVSLIDEQIGGLLEVIEQRGELDHTAVVFTSDHGEHNGDYGLIYKSTFLDAAVRVPLIVRTPATAAVGGATTGSLAEWIDVGPTLVELAGGRLGHEQFACSLMPTVLDPQRPHRPSAISELAGEVMLLDQRWKAALNRQGRVYLLFDRQADPLEQDNRAGRTAAVETELRLRLLERLVSAQVTKR